MTQPSPEPQRVLGTTNTCNNCNFYEQPPTGVSPPLGRCHYAAPAIMPEVQGQGRIIWPMCQPTDWCGQWSAIV